MIVIPESGMTFGPFADNNVFYIEKSKIYQELQQRLPIAEFLVLMRDDSIWIVEAKSSSPNPENKESEKKFDDFITDISDKLIDALTLAVSVIIKRHDNAINEIHQNLQNGIISGNAIKLCLIIKGHKDEWLIPIQDALNQNQQLYRNKKIWRFEIAVMNDEMARMAKLIC
ncbi:MAG: hypothetical protein ABRQ39_08515 [Candidatus Eremiobacterota bacterium]